MTSKRYLSDKKSKTAQTTISTSPATKDWVQRYVNVQHKKKPSDPKFASISAFYNFVMESVLTILEKGKTLEDFKRLVDRDVETFYDNITFKAIVPFYESSIELNKYVESDLDLVFKFAMRYRNFAIEKGSIEADKNILNTLERFKNFLLSNNVTKIFNFEIIENRIIIEYSAFYSNIHFNYSKIFIALASAMGLKIRDVFYDKNDNYVKIDTVRTDLFLDPKQRLKERKALLKDNIKFLLNDFNLLNDTSRHLWVNLSDNKNVMISFQDVNQGVDILTNMIQNVQKHVSKKELLSTILKMFEKFHWINIIDIDKLSFQFLKKEDTGKEISIFNKVIKNYSTIKEKEGILSLE